AVMRLTLAMSMPPRIGDASLRRNDSIRQATRSLRTAPLRSNSGSRLDPIGVNAWRRSARLALAAGLEAPAVVAGLDDVAVVREAVEQRRGHLGIAEHLRPLGEGEVGGDDDRSALVEPADQMKEELAACEREGQVAELVEDHEVDPRQRIGGAPGT